MDKKFRKLAFIAGIIDLFLGVLSKEYSLLFYTVGGVLSLTAFMSILLDDFLDKLKEFIKLEKKET